MNCSMVSISYYFNSRPCERGDDPNRAIPNTAIAISILAPARGATQSTWMIWAYPYFNSRPCERGDNAQISTQTAFGIFQFSPLREGRLEKYFLYPVRRTISILAPARGATTFTLFIFQFRHNFNSRPCERGDEPLCLFCVVSEEFQFSPLREGRHLCRLLIFMQNLFQFSPLREGRPGMEGLD